MNAKEEEAKVRIICPTCNKKKFLKVPLKVLSEGVTTISIPVGIICEHHFQVFVDSYLTVRGYQPIHYEFPKIEFYESRLFAEDQKIDGSVSYNNSISSQNLINILRSCVDDIEILGSALFSVEGKVVYSSIPHKTLLDTIREFEIRNKKKMVSIIKMFLELENHQKVCSEYIKIHDTKFILILIVSDFVTFGMGVMFLREIANNIKKFV